MSAMRLPSEPFTITTSLGSRMAEIVKPLLKSVRETALAARG